MELVFAIAGISSGLLAAYVYVQWRIRVEGKRKRIYAEQAEAERQRLATFINNQPEKLTPYPGGIVHGAYLDHPRPSGINVVHPSGMTGYRPLNYSASGQWPPSGISPFYVDQPGRTYGARKQ